MMPVCVIIEAITVKRIMAAMTSCFRAFVRLAAKVCGSVPTPLKAQTMISPRSIASAILRFKSRYHAITKMM